MRLWTVNPKHLDSKGLVALWRKGQPCEVSRQTLDDAIATTPGQAPVK